MARYVGDQQKIAIILESGTYASVSGTGQWPGLVQEHEINSSINTQEIRYAGQGNRDVGIFVDTALDEKGKMKFYPQDWRLLGFAMGSVVDGGSPSPYTHTFTAIDNNVSNAYTSGTLNPFMSFTVEEAMVAPGTGLNKVKTINGCVIDTIEYSASAGGIIQANVDYIGQSVTYTSGTPTATTTSALRPFLWADVKVHIPSGTIIQEVRDWSFKLMNNLNAPHYNNGSKVIAIPIPENRSYELDVTIDATSERSLTFYTNYFKSGNTFNALLEINCVDAGTGSRDIFIAMSGCKMVDMTDPTKSSQVTQQKILIKPQTVTALVDDLIFRYNPW